MASVAAPPPTPAVAGERAPRWRQALGRWEMLVLALIVAVYAIGASNSEEFLTPDSFTTASADLTEVAMIAIPLTFIIVAAEIDLSVASTLALSSAVMARLWNANLPLEAIIPLCLGVGALCGALNGFLVTRFGLPSLAVTIGTLALFRGLAYVVIGSESVTDFPPEYTDWAFGTVGDTAVPNPLLVVVALAAVGAIVLHATPLGRTVVAIGANREAARFSGLRVKRTTFWLFVASGGIAAGAGVMLSLRNSTAAANVGEGLELTCVAVVLLGGVSIFGGRGTILGVVLALFLLGGVQKGLALDRDISQYWVPVVTGALLIGSVLAPNLYGSLAERRRRARLPRTTQRQEHHP